MPPKITSTSPIAPPRSAWYRPRRHRRAFRGSECPRASRRLARHKCWREDARTCQTPCIEPIQDTHWSQVVVEFLFLS